MNSYSIFEFDSPKEIAQWFSINDAVMGGVSVGSLVQGEPGIARFHGCVSFENKGGFASVRTHGLSLSLAAYDGIEMCIRGDGKKYKLRLKTDLGPKDVCYEISFQTNKAIWGAVRLPFNKAVVKYRGFKMPFCPNLDPAKIKSLGLLISDKQEGNFCLDVDWIRAFKLN